MTATIFQPRVWMTFCVMSWKSSFHRATSPVTHSVAVNCVFFSPSEQPKTLRKLVSLLSDKKTHFPSQKENLECCSYAAEKNRSKVKLRSAHIILFKQEICCLSNSLRHRQLDFRLYDILRCCEQVLYGTELRRKACHLFFVQAKNKVFTHSMNVVKKIWITTLVLFQF